MTSLFLLAGVLLFGAECVIDVPEGQTLTQTADVNAVTEGDVLVKTGPGIWQAGANGKCVGNTVNFSRMEVREGTVEVGCSTGRFFPPRVEVKAGAILKQTHAGSYSGNNVTVYLEKGSTWNLNSLTPLEVKVAGPGTVKGFQSNNKAFTDWFAVASAPDFCGTLSGGSPTFVNGDTHTLTEALKYVTAVAGDGTSSIFNFKPAAVVPGRFSGSVRTYVYGDVDFRNAALWNTASGTTTKIDDYSSFTISGGYAAISPWYVMLTDPHVFTIRNTAVVGGAPARRSKNTGAQLKRMTGMAYGPGNNTGPLTIRVTDGGQYYLSSTSGGLQVLTNGVLHTYASLNYLTGLFDGGIWKVDPDSDGYGGVTKGGTLSVGPKGMRISQDSQTQGGSLSLAATVQTAAGCAADGGLVAEGFGEWTISTPFALTGPVHLKSGRFSFSSTTATQAARDSLTGIGSLELGTAYLGLPNLSGGLNVATGACSRLVVSGAACVYLNALTFGDPASARDAALLRKPGGVLVIGSDIKQPPLLGETSSLVKFAGGLSTDAATGLVKEPIFFDCAYQKITSTVDHWDHDFYLTGYDDAKGLYAITNYTAGLDGGADSLAYVAGHTLAADATAQVAALNVIGSSTSAYMPYSAGTSLKLNAGSRLTVGKDGLKYAYVLMNTAGGEKTAAIKGEGTLDFGSREGVFIVNRRPNACCMAKIAGTGGVTFAGSSSTSGQSIHLNANEYSGGTWVNAIVALAHSGTSFGTGKVTIGDGHGSSAVTVESEAAGQTFANDLEINHYGKLNFNASAEWSGDVVLKGTARIRVPTTDAVATLSGTVSGERLEMIVPHSLTNSAGIPIPGELVMTHANTYAGGTALVRSKLTLKGAGTAGTGRIEMDRGVLRLEPADDLTVANDISGIGTVQVATRKNVTFGSRILADPIYCTDLTLDVAARRVEVDTLAGFSSVTTSRSGSVDLYVLDATPFAGTVAANVTLHLGEKRSRAGLATVIR